MIGCLYSQRSVCGCFGKRACSLVTVIQKSARFNGIRLGLVFVPGAFPFCFPFPPLDLQLLTLISAMAIGQSGSSARPRWWVENRKGVCHPGCGTFRGSPCASILPTSTRSTEYGEVCSTQSFTYRLSHSGQCYGVVVTLALFPSVKISTKKKRGNPRPLEGSGLE